MKALFSIFSAVFLTVGSIIGAGFISGRELLSFFGYNGFIKYVIFSGVLLCFSMLLIYKAGKNFGETEEFNKRLFKNPKPFNFAVIISTCISLGGVLNGLDNIFNIEVLNKLPIISTLILLISNITARFGIKGIERASIILVPLTIILMVIMLLSKNQFKFSASTPSINGGIKALLFVSMNTFVNLPVIICTAKNKSKKSLIISAILVAIILSSLSILILGAINFSGAFAINSPIPLLSVLRREKASLLFALTLFLALTSSAITAYYPIYNLAVSKGKKGSLVWISAGLILFSRLGIKTITDFLYPIIGVFGFVYLVKCIIFFYKIKKLRYKNKKVANNSFI